MNFLYNERIKYDLLILFVGLATAVLMIYCILSTHINFYFMATVWIIILGALGLLIRDSIDEYRLRKDEEINRNRINVRVNRLSLLNENDGIIRSWNLLGKVSILIGRDEKTNRYNNERSVDINLSISKYAAQISENHAVLNWADGNWFLEDISEGNGLEIRKHTGKILKLADDTACRLEYGDIIYIGSARLLAD